MQPPYQQLPPPERGLISRQTRFTFLAGLVPGIIIAMGLAFVPYLVVERGLGPIDAIKESWRITKGHKWQLFLLVLALLGINLLGLLALVVGIFVAIPVTMIAFVHAYRTLAT